MLIPSCHLYLTSLSLICYIIDNMEVKKRRVNFFKNINGKAPVKEWFKKIKDKRALAKIDIRIRRAGLGNFGDHKSVGDSVIELRIPYGPAFRVYFAIVENDEILLLLVGGDKSTQTRDIDMAKRNLKEWRLENE
jgi:putative addiction module killer protein